MIIQISWHTEKDWTGSNVNYSSLFLDTFKTTHTVQVQDQESFICPAQAIETFCSLSAPWYMLQWQLNAYEDIKLLKQLLYAAKSGYDCAPSWVKSTLWRQICRCHMALYTMHPPMRTNWAFDFRPGICWLMALLLTTTHFKHRVWVWNPGQSDTRSDVYAMLRITVQYPQDRGSWIITAATHFSSIHIMFSILQRYNANLKLKIKSAKPQVNRGLDVHRLYEMTEHFTLASI